jgi:methyl-accepting chemotaxis protein
VTLGLNFRLAQKLRLASAVMLVLVLLGSLAAYLKMRQASQISEDVASRQMPSLMLMRDLRVYAVESSTALKSYLLFGIDPAMASRYRGQFERALSQGDSALKQIEAQRGSFAGLVDLAKLDAILSEYRAFEDQERQVEQMAVGQGNEATGKAFDMLQVGVAQHYDRLSAILNEGLQEEIEASNNSLAQTVQLARAQAISMWVAILVGGLLGLLMSELTIRRVVRSVLMVGKRAQAIAEGDLTGEALALDANDEVTNLARSINRMQDNLREMIGTMMETAATVHGDAAELSRTTADSSRRTQERSQQTRQAAAAMQEMSISIAEVSQHAQNAAGSARQASAIAREGGTNVEQVLSSMQNLSTSARDTAETVRRLGKESEQIIRIVNVIEEIAQKTNLLALNAAIEAARAGEHGRGFAVVAGEVRRLAESTRSATSEIAQTIQGIQDHTRGAVEAMDRSTERVSDGVATAQQAGESLKHIIDAADQVDRMIAQIAVAATEQAEAARQSSENIDAINRLGEESSASVPATTAIVDSVEAGARRLQEHIGRFRLEEERRTGGSGSSGSRTTRAALAFGTR